MPSSNSKSARSGDPRRRPTKPVEQPSAGVSSASAEDRYAPQAWGSKSAYEDLTFPSGQLAQVRRPGVEGLMAAGVLSQMDTLTPMIAGHKAKGTGKRAKEVDEANLMREVLDDPNKMVELIHLLDRVLCHCVVRPEIKMAPNDITLRKDHEVYADQVDLDDKMFLFNYAVGGTRNLERFRSESAELVGSVHDVEDAEADAR